MSNQAPPPPPHISPDGNWVWNGSQWLPNTAPPPTGPPQGYPNQYARPAQKNKGRNIALSLVGGVALLIVVGAIGDSDTPVNDKSAISSAADDSSPLPEDQRAFLGAVGAGQEAAEDATELQVVEARKTRADAMCEVLSPDKSVTDWIGTVENVETTLGGDGGVLALQVAEEVKVSTWNNGMSDIGDNTIIEEGTALWDQMVPLEEGDMVTFSGKFIKASDCISESSLMDENGMRTPDFVFRFTFLAKQ